MNKSVVRSFIRARCFCHCAGLALLVVAFSLVQAQPDISPNENEPVEINLPGNSINEVLGLYEMLTGKRLVRDANLAGPNLALVVSGAVPKKDAISLLESALLLNGYSLVPVDDTTTKVIGSKKSPLGEGVPLYADAALLPSGEQVVSYFMLLRYISTKDALQVFEGYVSLREQGKIVAVPNSNALVISDNTPLIRRLINLQRLIDVPGAKMLTEFVPLVRADAEKVADTVNQILDQEKKENGGNPGKATIEARTSPAEAKQPEVSTNLPAPLTTTSSVVQVVPDVRTNRILIVATENRMSYVRQLVLDLDEAVALEQPLERSLRFVSAGDVLPVLQSILAEGEEASDGQTPQASPRTQQVEDNFLSSGGTSSSGGGTGKPDKLTAPRESTAPLAVSVGKSRIIADRSANKIIVIGPPESRNKASKVLDMLDQKPKQVYLATVIGQLTLGNGIEVGFDYLVKNQSINGNNIGGLLRTRSAATDLLPDPSALITNAALPLASGLTIYGTIAETVDVYAKALATDNRFKILSRPVVYTANNKKAMISSGQAVPIPVSTLTSAIATGGPNDTGTALASNIQYKDVVLKLEVIPLINSNNEVTLTVAQQNDSILERVLISNNEVPVIGTQELTTTVTVKNRQTVVLGGLITEEKQDLKTGIPIIGSIPGLGYLFSTTKKTTTRRELIVLIQPLIVASEADEAEANYIEKSMSKLQDDLYDDQMEVRKAKPVKAPGVKP